MKCAIKDCENQVSLLCLSCHALISGEGLPSQAYHNSRRMIETALIKQSEQEPLAGKGKEFSEQLKLCARNVAFVASGQVDMSSAAMQEMFALIDHVCVGLDSPPALAQTEQEPVACIGTNGELMWLNKPKVIYSKAQPLYMEPPKREWVGLTNDEVKDCIASTAYSFKATDIARAVEAKLKEKNT